jgi:predicted DNA-binding transcriptional regulator AlpA
MNESDEELESINAVGDRLLNVEQLAQILGVKVSTIHDWRYRGGPLDLPPAVRLGSALRWRASDVRKFLDDLKTE